jgi:predicted component of type VI protein secretion system
MAHGGRAKAEADVLAVMPEVDAMVGEVEPAPVVSPEVKTETEVPATTEMAVADSPETESAASTSSLETVPPPAEGWRIRVQDVTGPAGETPEGPYALIAIRDGGLATSSTTARRWQRGGDVLHHILDPRTGLPAAPVWRTVSVAAGSCADANAASTAAVIRGRRAIGWLNRLGLPSRLVDATGAVFTVVGWPDDSERTV